MSIVYVQVSAVLFLMQLRLFCVQSWCSESSEMVKLHFLCYYFAKVWFEVFFYLQKHFLLITASSFEKILQYFHYLIFMKTTKVYSFSCLRISTHCTGPGTEKKFM
jgi:hypothetical protein